MSSYKVRKESTERLNYWGVFWFLSFGSLKVTPKFRLIVSRVPTLSSLFEYSYTGVVKYENWFFLTLWSVLLHIEFIKFFNYSLPPLDPPFSRESTFEFCRRCNNSQIKHYSNVYRRRYDNGISLTILVATPLRRSLSGSPYCRPFLCKIP